MKKKWLIISAILVILLMGCAMVGPILSNVEHPNYEVILAQPPFEIRQYSPMVIAEVEVKGERKKAISNGFRLLADYIFGNNTIQQKIAMTAPVQQQNNAKIAMTAPVQQQLNGDSWKVSFVMPAEYGLSTLPKPNNERVSLKNIAAKKFIVMKFSGSNSQSNISKHKNEFYRYLQKEKISSIGSPKYAYYNPPWTLPLFRRNEIMLEINR